MMHLSQKLILKKQKEILNKLKTKTNMKNLQNLIGKSLFVSLLAFIVACGAEGGDKKAQLEKLKNEQAALNSKIQTLETEIAKANPDSINPKTKIVEVLALQPQDFKHYVEIQGSVDAEENVLVSPRMLGVITNISAKEGDKVSAGQVLAQIDDDIMQTSLQQAKTNLSFVNTIYKKRKNLWDQNIGTELDFLTAKNNKESVEKSIATLNKQIESSKIKSPINGTVDKVNVKLGENAAPGQPAFRVVNSSNLKVTAQVTEAYINNLKKGNDVVILIPDIKKEISSKVSFLSQSIDEMSRTFTAEAKISNTENVRPNMIAIMKIVDYTANNTIVIPVNVVQNNNTEKYVFVAINENNKLVARKKVISAGRVQNGQIEVNSGLSKDDKLINVGFQGLQDGEIIRL